MILEDTVAVVTGAGQGVGRGIALALAGEGARVAVVGRTAEKCDAVAKRYADFGVHRLTVAIRARTVDDTRNEVARLGDELVAPTLEL